MRSLVVLGIKYASALALLLGFATSGAASGATVHCGDILTKDTTLTQDLHDCPASGLNIGADDITVKLNGHTIDGQGSSSPFGINNTSGFDNVKIIGRGRIQEFGYGYYAEDQVSSVLRGIVFRSHVAGAIRLEASTGNVIRSNRLLGVGGTGDGILIRDSDNNTLQSNVIRGFSEGLGVDTRSDYTSIKSNVVTGSQDVGIGVLGSNNVVTSNVARRNGGDGISIFGTETTIRNNSSDRNGDDGIDVETAGAILTNNHTRFNEDLGIEAVPGTIDGGGNSAKHNGNPQQCLNVSC